MVLVRAEMTRPSSLCSRFLGLTIANVKFTDEKLGRGADATVYAVDWNGTVCAAKRLHEILLEDESPGGADKFISNFEAECLTWSKLRHPSVVQFLGVYLERSSRLPVLVMEKMDTSLRLYLENHSKQKFPLNQKVFVLRQVTQALAYLHNQNPPLVHHDLTPNNVLLSVVSLVTKVSDFGMSRVINPSTLSRKSSIKGTQAFMAPEALHDPPRYNERLDVFSFGSVILNTLTHEWPNPGPPTRYEADKIIGLSELQRRKRYVEMFTAQEKEMFLPIVCSCLEISPNKRPSSVMLVQDLRRIESTLPRDGHVGTPVEQLLQQLSAKEEECRQKDEALMREKAGALRENRQALKEKNDALKEKDEVIRKKDEALRERNVAVGTLQAENQWLKCQLDQATKSTPMVSVKHPLRDWRELGKCRKVIHHSQEGGGYIAVAVNREGQLAVTDMECVHLLSKEGAFVRSIGEGVLSSDLYGVAFDLKGNVWVTDMTSNNVFKLSQDDRLLQTIDCAGSDSDHFNQPRGVSVSPEGLIYICDCDNHRVTVHDEEGKFLFMFGSQGSDPGCFGRLSDITFGLDGLVYVTDRGNGRVCVWSKQGTFLQRAFKTKHTPTCIAATSDNHLVITSYSSNTVMVYTVGGQLVHEFKVYGSDPGSLIGPNGICVDNDGLVYVADCEKSRVQVF